MPINGIPRSEGPSNRVPRETRSHMWVVENVFGIVIVDEVVPTDGTVKDQRSHEQQQSKRDDGASNSRLIARFLLCRALRLSSPWCSLSHRFVSTPATSKLP